MRGRATEPGTRRFADRALARRRIVPQHFRAGPGGLTLSSFGLGTYIGAPDAPTDRAVEEAVGVSLSSGRINVIDSALNYRHQRAERSIGRALERAVAAGPTQRDEVFLSTKIGYLAPDGESGVSPGVWIERELLQPGILRRAEIVDGSHAMSPRFLEDQFERSRTNLGVETIDLLYLHNAPDAQLASVGRPEFLRRLGEAFRLLETFRAAGTLGEYGLATWGSLRATPDDPSFLDLASVVDLARDAGGSAHGFRFVQFPFSLSMPEAVSVRNQPCGRSQESLFTACERLAISCFTSVPLHQGQLGRSVRGVDGLTSAQTAIQFARSAPGTLGPMVGQKRAEHLSENLRLAETAPWDETQFRSLLN